MKSVKNEFPNPVLAKGRDDYIESCYFETDIDRDHIEVDSNNIVINITYKLNCKGLQKLIENDMASVVINVRSTGTAYSKLFEFEKYNNCIKINIPKFSVSHRIEIEGMIVSTTSINEFVCEGEFNELYFGSVKFSIRKGDILACENSQIIYIDDSELEKPITSIFSITEMPDQKDDILPVFDDEKILVNLRPELFRIYSEYVNFNNGSLRRYVTSVIIYPVLIEALAQMRLVNTGYIEDSIADKRWFRAIEKNLIKLGYNIDNDQNSIVTMADNLLGNISLDALTSFKEELESELNSGEVQMIGSYD